MANIFQIRTQHSYSLVNSNSGLSSVDSVIMYDNGFNHIIQNLTNKQNKKSCKTQTKIKRESIYNDLIYSQIRTLTNSSIKLPTIIQQIINQRIYCLDLAKTSTLNSIYGAFFGYVIGDVIGSHMIYQTSDLISAISAAFLMKGGGTYSLGPAQATDQTQILLSTSYGLIQCQHNYDQFIMATNYIHWLESKPFDLPVLIPLSLNGIRSEITTNPNKNVIIQKLLIDSKKNSKYQSNLGLFRIIPLTLYGINLVDQQFIELIKEQMQIICPNSLVIQTAIVYAKFLRTIFITQDIQKAFNDASKWVYSKGSAQIIELWQHIDNRTLPNKTSKLKTSFSYAFTQCYKDKIDFIDSLLNVLTKVGDRDSNSAITMAIVGSIVGYNNIPSYFRNQIINSSMRNSITPRHQRYLPSKIIQIVPKLLSFAPYSFEKKSI